MPLLNAVGLEGIGGRAALAAGLAVRARWVTHGCCHNSL
jgi:hypothetical protein